MNFNFSINGFPIAIDLEMPQEGIVKVPIFRRPNQNTLSFETLMPVDGFKEDIESLLPERIQLDYLDDCMDSLGKTVEKHFKQFGRVLPEDMYLYISLSVIIMDAISKEMNTSRWTVEEKIDFVETLAQRALNR
ncbi:MAG: hypothetical protein R2780_01625 [Crocinitomicaceae bacterium]|nr:hypothetical protein [Crocinitomicaceae bacterium]